MAHRSVVFICEHGAAKSVIAAAYLNQLAQAHGVGVRALARGTDPDPALSAATVAGLRAAGLALPDHDPRQPTNDELTSASAGRASGSCSTGCTWSARPTSPRVAASIPVRYMIFDLLWLDDRELVGLPYLERRALLAELVKPGDGWLVPAHHVDGGPDLLAAATERRLEGIVVKRNTSLYVPGKRSPAWITMCRRRGGVIDVVHGSDPRRWPAWMTGCVYVSVT